MEFAPERVRNEQTFGPGMHFVRDPEMRVVFDYKTLFV
jgi:hypothetical protein